MPNENLSLDTESTEYIFFGKMATFGAAKSLSRGVSYSFPLWKEIEYSAATAGGHGGKIILFYFSLGQFQFYLLLKIIFC